MNQFISEHFLLQSNEAKVLYHEYAADMPIIDYHSHLPPNELAQNKQWQNLSQVWLDGDHYKWRQMRTNGVSEYYCTGNASDREKFDQFASIMPYILRNPLYHWSHLELARYFDIDDVLLNTDNADEIWHRTSAKFDAGLSAHDLLEQSHVQLVCTTDDPVDSLEYHIQHASSKSKVSMLPTWRPDNAMAVENPTKYNAYIDKLSAVADIDISHFQDLLTALYKRHDYFHSLGCRLSDHGLNTCSFIPASDQELATIFNKVRAGSLPTPTEVEQFKTALLLEFARMDAKKGWTKQLHLGALRNNNSRMNETLGPDKGFDSIGDWSQGEKLALYLDTLDREESLPKTIIYNLNPSDNEMIATMIGNFQDGKTAGKLQMGSGWWFLDQKDGIERQIEALSQLGSLGRFVGMLTDSRSFLSFTRHEYFRRVLCNVLGNDIKQGLLPKDFNLIGNLVKDICYNNAANYFGFDLPKA
ncbi:glucuronate isomerase [Saccharobesus litoralis]|uniref:Uronate isomerase n=1 Tax=Saccharobesus litoralis TaxID=2172099 RepID=A0A2S0VXI3_9ALTE|nr:glucuronate isomerase [Saccharobesus litoralis]AWB68921.1 glucuronate isomerase [Saccharobesus litoralis]